MSDLRDQVAQAPKNYRGLDLAHQEFERRWSRRSGIEAPMRMRANINDAVPGPRGGWKLAKNAAMPLPRGRSAKIVRVGRGTVLVTQEGDFEDHVLEAGDEFVLDLRGLAVAWALTEAEIIVREAP